MRRAVPLPVVGDETGHGDAPAHGQAVDASRRLRQCRLDDRTAPGERVELLVAVTPSARDEVGDLPDGVEPQSAELFEGPSDRRELLLDQAAELGLEEVQE